MTKKEAMKLICSNEYVSGTIDGVQVYVGAKDIKINLECNDYELNLDFEQDLTGYSDSDYFIFQGHSLGEIENVKFEKGI